MGRGTFTREAYTHSHTAFVPKSGPATAKAEQQARETGKLHPLVDPAGYGVIRPSRLRFEERPDGLFELTIGTSVPSETRLDTTGSMGGNVEVAIKVLPDSYELCSLVLPGCDLHMAIGIFGDVVDRFVLCRPQFEMLAEKIVQQLTLMVPERQGGDAPEDPHYGLFGAAYLTDFYINKIGLKSYDFTVSDAPARDRLDESQLVRIFGKEVFVKVEENGFQMSRQDLPTTKEVVQDLLKRAHAFFLQVDDSRSTHEFWTEVFGRDRVVVLPNTGFLPQVQAAIIGLTEGTLDLKQVPDFLQKNNVDKENAKLIARSVANIPIGAQRALPNYVKRPKKGDLFRSKTDLWPISAEELEPGAVASKPSNMWL
jgi:hypothetical protein